MKNATILSDGAQKRHKVAQLPATVESGIRVLFETHHEPDATLYAAAFNDAVRKAEATTQEKMGSLTSGLGGMAGMLPPGFKLPF